MGSVEIVPGVHLKTDGAAGTVADPKTLLVDAAPPEGGATEETLAAIETAIGSTGDAAAGADVNGTVLGQLRQIAKATGPGDDNTGTSLVALLVELKARLGDGSDIAESSTNKLLDAIEDHLGTMDTETTDQGTTLDSILTALGTLETAINALGTKLDTANGHLAQIETNTTA